MLVSVKVHVEQLVKMIYSSIGATFELAVVEVGHPSKLFCLCLCPLSLCVTSELVVVEVGHPTKLNWQ